MALVDDVVKRFNQVQSGEKHSAIFTIARPASVPIPPGEDAEAFQKKTSHPDWTAPEFTLRGIQRRPDGSFVLTGGSSGNQSVPGVPYSGDSNDTISDINPGGYVYLTTPLSSASSEVVTAARPPFVWSGAVAEPQIGDQPGGPVDLPNNALGGGQAVALADGTEVLAVGYGRLNDEDESQGTSTILFYRLDSLDAQGNPRLLYPLFISRLSAGNYAGDAVGLTLTAGLAGTAAAWLLVVANYDAKRLDFYTAAATVFDDDAEPSGGFTPCGHWSASTKLYTTIGDTNWEAYQNVNLFTQSDGSLWLIGMHMSSHQNDDWADLYSLYNPDLLGTAWGTWGHGKQAPSGWSLTKMGKMHFTRKDRSYDDDGPRFKYGAGYYYDAATKAFEVDDCEGNLSGSHRNQIQCSRWLGTT